jgi:hypothetical protein
VILLRSTIRPAPTRRGLDHAKCARANSNPPLTASSRRGTVPDNLTTTQGRAPVFLPGVQFCGAGTRALPTYRAGQHCLVLPGRHRRGGGRGGAPSSL